jgi:hypothetical protein
MANPGAVEVGFNEETLDAIRTLQRTVDRFTPESGGFRENGIDRWSDEYIEPTRIVVENVEDGYVDLSVVMNDPHDSLSIIIRDAHAIDNLIGMLIHLRRRAFGHE